MILLNAPVLLLAAFVSSASCETKELTVRGDSMHPLLKEGETVISHPPECVKIERGDLAIFETAAHKENVVIKRIAGIPDDDLKVAPDGTVMINGKPATGADGKPYNAGQRGAKMIGLYAGKIGQGNYLILGKPGTLDSSRIGLMDITSIRGIVKRR